MVYGVVEQALLDSPLEAQPFSELAVRFDSRTQAPKVLYTFQGFAEDVVGE